MGQQVYLTATKAAETGKAEKFNLFEAYNSLPVFWMLLLDPQTLREHRQEMVDAVNQFDVEALPALDLPRETLQNNIATAALFLEMNQPLWSRQFKQFSDYLLLTAQDYQLQLDILELASFTSVEQFWDLLIQLSEQVRSGERPDWVETEGDFFDRAGFEPAEVLPEGRGFSAHSTEYAQLQREARRREEVEREQQEKIFDETSTKNILLKTGKSFIITGVAGAISLILGLALAGLEVKGIGVLILVLAGIALLVASGFIYQRHWKLPPGTGPIDSLLFGYFGPLDVGYPDKYQMGEEDEDEDADDDPLNRL
ncbi:hypothetical protein [Boudabousia marimammalium]|uniref:Uncharacterized protein n=1 Tax=Boudabousia marimammalium TaxID=156892 RepID=A0A1Q5PSP9_9ACTO|nr:hypothetical protein [Boudabousia marimammalium]OKL50539.1 hypothetical protein BM477_00790 [Boudabousia marimammalium]